jgi:hypothetical protein
MNWNNQGLRWIILLSVRQQQVLEGSTPQLATMCSTEPCQLLSAAEHVARTRHTAESLQI